MKGRYLVLTMVGLTIGLIFACEGSGPGDAPPQKATRLSAKSPEQPSSRPEADRPEPAAASPKTVRVEKRSSRHFPPSFTDSKGPDFLGGYSSVGADTSLWSPPEQEPPESTAEEIYVSLSPVAGQVDCPLGDLDGDCTSDALPVTVMLLNDRGGPVPDQPFLIQIHHCSGKLIWQGRTAESFIIRTGPDGTAKLDVLLGPKIKCDGCAFTRFHRTEEDKYPYIVGINAVTASISRVGNKGRRYAHVHAIAYPGPPAKLIVPPR